MTKLTSKHVFSWRAIFRVARPNSFDRAYSDALRCARKHAQAALGRGTRLIAVLAFVSLLAMGAGCGKGGKGTTAKAEFEVDKVYERGPVAVHVRLDKTKITIADTVLLQFEATLQPGYEMQMPKVDKLENFGIVDWNNLGKKLDDENNVVMTYQYRLEPLLSGKYEIPAFKFQFHDANDPNATHELASEPIAVEVTSLLGDQRANLVIEDIEGVVEMPKAASRWWLWMLLVLGVAAVPAAWFLLRSRRAKRLVRIFRPAHELAYARLRALVAEDLVEQGKIPEFYERISGILRHYIEDRFDLHAPERTTEEFLDELRYTQTLAPADKKVLEEFLTHCDLVKFAQHDPTTEQVQRTFDLVKDFIERTKSEERKVDVTDKIEPGGPEAGAVGSSSGGGCKGTPNAEFCVGDPVARPVGRPTSDVTSGATVSRSTIPSPVAPRPSSVGPHEAEVP